VIKVARLRTNILEARDKDTLENMINKFLYDLPEGDFVDIKYSTYTFYDKHSVYTALILYKIT